MTQIELLLQRGVEQQTSGAVEESLSTFNEIVELDPTNGQAWYGKAIAEHELGNLTEAIAAYQMSIQHAGENAALPYYNLGNLLQSIGQHADAARCYLDATNVDPLMSDAWINLGRLMEDSGEHEEAIRCYDIALSVTPDDGVALSNRGNSYRSLGNMDEAESSYLDAIKLIPNDPAALMGLGICYLERGKQDAGLTLMDQAIGNSGHPITMAEKAFALAKLDRWQEAVTLFDEAINQDYQSPVIWNNRGECLAKLDNFEGAVESFERAIELESNFAPAYFGLTRALVNAERLDEAKVHYQKLLEIADSEMKKLPAFAALHAILADK